MSIAKQLPESPFNSPLLMERPLYVFALQSEASHEFDDTERVFVGIGKLNAMYSLIKKITDYKPTIIINLGSAGSAKYKCGQVVCCTKFIQRDMDVTALGFQKYETPFSSNSSLLQYGMQVPGLPHGTCGTGDNFEMNHNTFDYDVVDMEAYALAWVAMQEQIPFLCLKYISDGADSAAAEDWQETVKHAAAALKSTMQNLNLTTLTLN